MKESVKAGLAELYRKYDHVLPSLSSAEAKFFKAIQDETANIGQMKLALRHLAAFLHKKYDKKCIVLIDEYDTPFNEAYEVGYLKSVIAFVSPIIRNVVKVSVINGLTSAKFDFGKLGLSVCEEIVSARDIPGREDFCLQRHEQSRRVPSARLFRFSLHGYVWLYRK